ncbi:IclR family transcriptional regulator [Saccharopolyspora sp. ASAGF58]|uniref:IclR family transcriptional regulator n=1 Tax=Saccharopolyspora sp. ASAGF58 TaxID=2719023 RepID=UPI00143FE28E|nr:IclR family transcriptional regulator [Saccharopolyspora sp. ASAGF58]QIZ39070.1 IclR family transcriptional regulator [Saccharopolyspora sp. ASAGF58]
MPETDSAGVRSVRRALELLGMFDSEHPARTVRELIDATGLAKSTVVRLVHTLQQEGLLWTRPDGLLAPGPGLLRWAHLAREAWKPPEEALTCLKELSDSSGGETVNIYVRTHTTRICIAQHEGTQNLRHVVRVGDTLPLWGGAASHVLLSRSEREDVVAVAETSPRGAEHADDLWKRSRAAAESGWSVSHGEREAGVSGIAAPIFARTGEVAAAVALGGPTTRFTDAQVRDWIPVLTGAAARLTSLDFIGAAQ